LPNEVSTRSAAILAGGRASRFDGRDKSALVVDGRRILDRQIAELQAVVDDVLIVGGRTELGSDGDPIRRVDDMMPGCGPLAGVHAALVHARHDAVFVVACDMPFVQAAFVDYLFSVSDGAAIVVPQTDRGYHPLCAIYTRACLGPVAARLAERRLTLRDLFDDVPIRVVAAAEIERFAAPARLLANVNTPAEYAGLEALQGHKP
jgi:molybdenum cofactor guanylyltransferase